MRLTKLVRERPGTLAGARVERRLTAEPVSSASCERDRGNETLTSRMRLGTTSG